jgi:glycosyltransferase involved in cell wall biosynthesis
MAHCRQLLIAYCFILCSMTIAFIHPHKAFLPEIIAYTEFFAAYKINTWVIRPDELYDTHCDVEWHFMGQHRQRNKHVITIHEYASASVPPFSAIKDTIKKYINTTPDYRIFNNDYVLKQFRPTDAIPFGIRNYGIPSGSEFLLPNLQKKYDFVYVGTVDKERRPEMLLNCFSAGPLKNRTLLVLSRNYTHLSAKYANAHNISFHGPIAYKDIYTHIQQARYGINYMPDIVPYNQQTSAKFIDYAACRMPIVTTDYAWVRDFQNKYGGRYFYLQSNLENFTWDQVVNFEYALPDLTSWTWDRQIRSSGVLEFLEANFPEIKF